MLHLFFTYLFLRWRRQRWKAFLAGYATDAA